LLYLEPRIRERIFMPTKFEALAIKSGKLTIAVERTQVIVGESRISKEHWEKCATKCKGEAAMIVSLKIEDLRSKSLSQFE